MTIAKKEMEKEKETGFILEFRLLLFYSVYS